MTRGDAVDFVAQALSGVGAGRGEAERTLDAIDRFGMCPGADWEH